MTPFIIGCFVILFILLAVFTGKTTLSKFEWLPGEEILWEEEGSTYYVSFPHSRGSNRPNSKVVLTGHRLLLCQKPLGSKDPLITHVLCWNRQSPSDAQTLSGTMKRGFVTMDILPTSLELVEEDEKVLLVVSVAPQGGSSTLPDQFRITIKDRKGLEMALRSLG